MNIPLNLYALCVFCLFSGFVTRRVGLTARAVFMRPSAPTLEIRLVQSSETGKGFMRPSLPTLEIGLVQNSETGYAFHEAKCTYSGDQVGSGMRWFS